MSIVEQTVAWHDREYKGDLEVRKTERLFVHGEDKQRVTILIT